MDNVARVLAMILRQVKTFEKKDFSACRNAVATMAFTLFLNEEILSFSLESLSVFGVAVKGKNYWENYKETNTHQYFFLLP